MVGQAFEDLSRAPVHDTVIGGPDFEAVLTMSGEFFTEATRAHLRAGTFTVVGKVTRVLQGDDELNLLRRTVLGAMGTQAGTDLISGFVKDSKLDLDTFDPVIRAPAVQLLPLAVFV
jgi:hypothetical protein